MIQAIEQNHIFALNRDCIASCIEISFLFAMQILNLVISMQSNLFIWLGNTVLCRSFQMVYLIATISIRTSYIHIWAHFALFFLHSQYLTLFNSDIAHCAHMQRKINKTFDIFARLKPNKYKHKLILIQFPCWNMKWRFSWKHCVKWRKVKTHLHWAINHFWISSAWQCILNER